MRPLSGAPGRTPGRAPAARRAPSPMLPHRDCEPDLAGPAPAGGRWGFFRGLPGARPGARPPRGGRLPDVAASRLRARIRGTRPVIPRRDKHDASRPGIWPGTPDQRSRSDPGPSGGNGGAGGRSRTGTAYRPRHFKCHVSTIPPRPHRVFRAGPGPAPALSPRGCRNNALPRRSTVRPASRRPPFHHTGRPMQASRSGATGNATPFPRRAPGLGPCPWQDRRQRRCGPGPSGGSGAGWQGPLVP
jgi:hypothetical protein